MKIAKKLGAKRKTRRSGLTNSGDLPSALGNFDALPDSAHVRLPVVEGLYGCGPATVWRRIKSGLIPAPTKIGNTTIWCVGDLRAALKGAQS